MIIVNIEYPGSWLELSDRNKAFEIESIISAMETTITDLAITLTMFENSQRALGEEIMSEDFQKSWERDRALRINVEEQYRNKLANPHDFYRQHDYHRLETEKLYRQEKLKDGEVPRVYKNRFPFIHAHSYLFSADTFSKYLSVLAQETEFDHVLKVKEQLDNTFPSLAKIRNSAQHSEDRIRGYGKQADVKKNRKMNLAPVDNKLIKAEGGVLALSNLNGDRIGYTIDDGSYQEFKINQNSLSEFVGLFQQLINGFQWSGPVKFTPNV